MAIAGVTQDRIGAVLKDHLTPSAAIRTPERLFGRDKNLLAISRALNSAGRQVFIFGDRGVGKTSLGLTAAALNNHSSAEPIYVPCGRTSSFADVMQAVGSASISIERRIDNATTGRQFGLTSPLGGANFAPGTTSAPTIPAPQTVNEALDIVRYICAKRQGPTIIVIDEMERLEVAAEREKFGEFIKNIPEVEGDVRFIFCGIANDINELLDYHPSAGRILETIELNRLSHSDRWRIIQVVSELLGIEVTREVLIRISQISDGFPHFVHLIGESMFWHMFDAEEMLQKTRSDDLRAGVAGALGRTEAILRAQYEKATMKTKNTEDYAEALWALADRTSDKRQLTEIYDSSYRAIMSARINRKELTRELLNQRLLSLRQDSHGRVVKGYGSGWFGFRENIMRGYVRLRAQAQGLEIGRDAAM